MSKMNGGLLLAALAAALFAGKRSGTPTSGYTPLVDTPPAAPPSAGGGDTFKPFVDWSDVKPTLRDPIAAAPELKPTGLKIVDISPPASAPAPAVTNYSTATAKSSVSSQYFDLRTVSRTSTTPKTSSWNWYTPGGTVTSRDPTPEESESGLGCPEVPGIWSFPGQSAMDLRYCSNPDCPALKDPSTFDQTIDPGTVPVERAILEDQGADSPAGRRWYCRVCRTYQG